MGSKKRQRINWATLPTDERHYGGCGEFYLGSERGNEGRQVERLAVAVGAAGGGGETEAALPE